MLSRPQVACRDGWRSDRNCHVRLLELGHYPALTALALSRGPCYPGGMRDVYVGPTDQSPEAGSGSTKPMGPLTDEEAIDRFQEFLDEHFAPEKQLPFVEMLVAGLAKHLAERPPSS